MLGYFGLVVKIPIDATIGSFSAIVCGVGR
jgi:hypothetical protein